MRLLGRGGMGEVFLAEHERLGRQVAIKVLRAQAEQMEVALARFEREIRVMAQVNSRHVAQAFDADVLEDGSPYLVMEYLDGRDLRAELKLRRAIPYPEAVAYMVQACAGVAAVHEQGIIHRDLKPNNLFVTQLDAARCLKVLDFGIVKLLSASDPSMTADNTSVGTPLYMSPEQLNNEREISPCADVWAMAVVLYELIAGVSPFAADRPGAVIAAIMLEHPPLLSRLIPGLPEPLAEVIAEGLEKSPARRIGSAKDLASRLAPFGMPTDQIIIASSTPSGRPVMLSRRDSLRPELSAKIEHEIGTALAKDNGLRRLDELHHLPSLARLAIPLARTANLQAPGEVSAVEREVTAQPAQANRPSDLPTRLELPLQRTETSAHATVGRRTETGSHWWGKRAFVSALLLLVLVILGQVLREPLSCRGSAPEAQPLPQLLPLQSAQWASLNLIRSARSTTTSQAVQTPPAPLLPNVLEAESARETSTIRMRKPRSQVSNTPLNTSPQKPPERPLPQGSDGNPAHL